MLDKHCTPALVHVMSGIFDEMECNAQCCGNLVVRVTTAPAELQGRHRGRAGPPSHCGSQKEGGLAASRDHTRPDRCRSLVPTVSLRLAVLNVYQGFFGPKIAVFGPKVQFLKLRSATHEARCRSPPSSFSLKLCVIVLHTHRYHPPKFQPNLKHHDVSLIFPHFARAAACLLLAAACCC